MSELRNSLSVHAEYFLLPDGTSVAVIFCSNGPQGPHVEMVMSITTESGAYGFSRTVLAERRSGGLWFACYYDTHLQSHRVFEIAEAARSIIWRDASTDEIATFLRTQIPADA